MPHSPGLASVPYAYSAAVGPSSTLVFCAGACPLTESGDISGDTFAEQAVVALNTLERVLQNAGATLRDLVQLRVLVASPARRDLVEAWDALTDVIGTMPPSTLTGVTVLGYPGQLVELEAVAELAANNGANDDEDDSGLTGFPNIGAPALTALRSAGFRFLSDLDGATMKELGQLHGVGPKALRMLREELGRQGLGLADE